MSIKLMSLVSKAPLGRASWKSVAHKLADFAADNGNSIFPSNDRVAQETGLSKRSVQRAIRLFLRKGLLIKLAEGGAGRGSTCHYELNVDLLRRLGTGETSLDAIPDQSCARRVCSVLDGSRSPAPSSATSGCRGDAQRVTSSRDKGVSQTPNPSVNHHSTVSTAPPASREELGARLREAAGDSIEVAKVQRSGLGPALEWLKAGIDLDRDILPAIREKSQSLANAHVWTWRYFDRSVRAWHARRTGSAASQYMHPDPATFSDSAWRRRLDFYSETGRWHGVWGPAPKEPGCLVPQHLLSERSET